MTWGSMLRGQLHWCRDGIQCWRLWCGWLVAWVVWHAVDEAGKMEVWAKRTLTYCRKGTLLHIQIYLVAIRAEERLWRCSRWSAETKSDRSQSYIWKSQSGCYWLKETGPTSSTRKKGMNRGPSSVITASSVRPSAAMQRYANTKNKKNPPAFPWLEIRDHEEQWVNVHIFMCNSRSKVDVIQKGKG